MSVFLVGKYYHYNFILDGRRYKATTGKTTKQAAERVEREERGKLESGYAESVRKEERDRGRQTIKAAAEEFIKEYSVKHRAGNFAEYKLKRVVELLGSRLILEVTKEMVMRYQTERLCMNAAGKTVNEEVALLLRLCGDQGDVIRVQLKRKNSLKLPVAPSPGKAFKPEDQDRMLAIALQSTLAARAACDRQARGEKAAKGDKQCGSLSIYPAMVVALNCGMRDAEMRNLVWSQINFEKRTLTVGISKTDAGTGRPIPLNETVLNALLDHARWYVRRFGNTLPDWFVFPGGGRFPSDPTVAITTLKTAWTAIRKKAGVAGRWHDTRHTMITELLESGAGDQTVMRIAGHVSKQMLDRYGHIGGKAKRDAVEGLDRARTAAAKERAAKQQEQAGSDTTPVVLQ